MALWFVVQDDLCAIGWYLAFYAVFFIVQFCGFPQNIGKKTVLRRIKHAYHCLYVFFICEF